MPELLIELFSEEIPARMQARARADLRALVTEGLVAAGLTYESAGAFSTPRRLTLVIEGLLAESPPQREERKGPKVDAPAAALEGFLRSTGLQLADLEKRADKGGEVYFAVQNRPGRPAAAIVAEVLESTIRAFPWPKSMRWGRGALRWVRPLHSVLCLLSSEAGSEVVPLSVEGITAGNTTEGHRFMAPARFAVNDFADYRAKLARAFVLLDSGEREAKISHDAEQLAFAAGLELVPDPALLAEVAGLVEWPVVLMGRIEAAFLHLPPEVLQTSMRAHQKFFAVKNPKTGRIEGFVTVANRETADHGATILAGNQKVLAARLSDAAFFWDNDLRQAKAGMGEWAEGLKAVTFHSKLGTQGERVARIAALAREIAPLVGADPDLAEQAAKVAKLDLRAAMVGEFPELQGVMGRYYALEAGLPQAVAEAARDHYSPLGPSDAVPTAPVSVAVALADKLDTLTGFWAIDEKPTGSKDPFALRRAALGVIRLLLGNGVRLGLSALSEKAYAILLANRSEADALVAAKQEGLDGVSYLTKPAIRAEALAQGVYFFLPPGVAVSLIGSYKDFRARSLPVPATIAPDLLAFLHDRLKVFLKDQGLRHDVIDACLAMPGSDDLVLLVKRAEALATVLQTEDGANLLQGYKRASNLLAQAEAKDGVEYSYGADPALAEGPGEAALFTALASAEAALAPALKGEDFAGAMAVMAGLRAPIDAFFTAHQVNSDNGVIRRNRLNLLHQIRQICGQVADLSRLEG